MKQLYELKGEGRSIRAIARDLGVSRNSVRKYLRSPQVPQAKEQTPRGSKLDPYKEYLRERLAESLENCVVLLRELRGRGYTGGYSILKEYVHPFRRPHLPQATRRFETEPGEQAQVDWGSFTYFTSEGKKKQVWAFVMVLSWSRAIYVGLVPQADVATFLRSPRQRLCSPGRGTPPLPLRQCQGGGAGSGGGRPTPVEPPVPGLCPEGRV